METKTERDLISKHRTLEKRIDELKLDLNYADADKKVSINGELLKLAEEKTLTEQQLKTMTERPVSRVKQKNVLTVLRLIISKLKLNPGGHPISSDQGTVIGNAIFGYIIWDILIGFNNDYGGYSIPKYYHEVNGNFDHTVVKDLLVKQLGVLNEMRDPDYLSLKEFVDGLAQQLRELAWEYDKNKRR